MKRIAKKIYSAILTFFSSPKCVFWLGFIISTVATAVETFRCRNTNYFDYQDSTRMFWDGITAYTPEYVMVHDIYFLYAPVFSVLFAPIFFLPWWLGPFVWNISNYSLFALAIKTLPSRYDAYKHRIFLFLLPVLLQAIFCYQHNTIVCYLFIFAYSLLERGKGFWAVFLIMMSACTKVYGGVELALLLCYPRMWRNLGYAILCGAGFICLPLINPNMDNPFVLYEQMFTMISGHHSGSDFVGLLFARGLKPFLLPNYREVQIVVLAVLSIAFFACYKRWKDFNFRVQVLAVLMGYIILFSDCPETHTYIISLAGYSCVFFIQENKKWYDWVLFWSLVFNFGIIPTDILCPRKVHEFIHETFWLDVYTFTLCWVRVIWWAVGPKSIKPALQKAAVAMLLLMLPATTVVAQNQPAKQASYQTGKLPSQRTFIVKGVRFTMKRIQGGSFMMGIQKSLDITSDDETPAHKVIVNNFYIGETEVTQDLWEAVMGKNRSKRKAPNHPVEYISYEDCKDFIQKLNKMTGMKFRLPSEAEWEYAARGGKKSKGYIYAGSNNIDEVGVSMQGLQMSHFPVASKKPNELGLYDMSGNVWELVEDFYGRYDSTHKSYTFHVIRGGGFTSFPFLCRTTNRYPYDHRRKWGHVGFRLAM